MPLQVQPVEQGSDLFRFKFTGRVRGMDTQSPDLALEQDHFALLQNVDLIGGKRFVRMDGSAAYDTNMDTDDVESPMGWGYYIPASGTAEFVWIEEDGSVNKWDAAGNATVVLGERANNVAISTGDETTEWNSVLVGDYLIFSNPTDGNWKYDGTNWLPLGAKIISNCESGDDADWDGETTETSTVAFGLQSYATAAIGAGGNDTLTYDPTTLNVDTGLGLAKDYTSSDRLGFWVRVTDASELDEAASYVQIETDTSNYFRITADNWTDKDGTTITFADNTWHRVEVVISDGTETGTYDHTSVDRILFYFEEDGGAGFTGYLDQVYMIYASASVMPGVRANGEWKNCFFGLNSSSNPSRCFYSKAGGPDEYNATANFDVDENDGQVGTGMAPFYNQVFLTKERSCHSLSGSLAGTTYPNYDFQLLRVTKEHGCSSHRSLVEFDKMLYFWWNNGIYVYDGTGTQKISDIVDATVDAMTKAREQQISGANYHTLNQIWWTHPITAGDNSRILKLDSQTKGFMLDQGQAIHSMIRIFSSGTEQLVTVNDDGQFGLQDSGTTFALEDTTNITSIVRLPWLSGPNEDYLMSWEDAYFNYPNGTGSMTVQARYADHPEEFSGASFATIGTLTQGSLGNAGWIQLGQTARWCQIQITTTNVAFELHLPITIYARQKERWA